MKSVFTENWFGTKFYMSGGQVKLFASHLCKKIFESNFNQAVIENISMFHEIAPNFTYLEKIVIFKV